MQNCRYLHPGAPDWGNYAMFATTAAPRPALAQVHAPPVVAERRVGAVEAGWVEGLARAKALRRRSMQRREEDLEYAEKRDGLSLTGQELDKQADYCATFATSPEVLEDEVEDEVEQVEVRVEGKGELVGVRRVEGKEEVVAPRRVEVIQQELREVEEALERKKRKVGD